MHRSLVQMAFVLCLSIVAGALVLKMPSAASGIEATVDIYELARIGKAYGSMSGGPNWDEDADINRDSIVDNDDLAICDKNYGETV